VRVLSHEFPGCFPVEFETGHGAVLGCRLCPSEHVDFRTAVGGFLDPETDPAEALLCHAFRSEGLKEAHRRAQSPFPVLPITGGGAVVTSVSVAIDEVEDSDHILSCHGLVVEGQLGALLAPGQLEVVGPRAQLHQGFEVFVQAQPLGAGADRVPHPMLDAEGVPVHVGCCSREQHHRHTNSLPVGVVSDRDSLTVQGWQEPTEE